MEDVERVLHKTADEIVSLAVDTGFDRATVISYKGLIYAIDLLRRENIGKHADSLLAELEKLNFEISHFLSESAGKLIPEEIGTFLVCALSYNVDEPDDLSSQADPHGLIAPFARRNYYRESVNRLKKIFRVIREIANLKKRDGRIFCNSRFPEKSLAYVSGLGFYGKNTLIIVPELGSLFVLGILFFPLNLREFDYEEERHAIYRRIKRESYWGEYCKNCNRCVVACPVGAIDPSGTLEEKLCFSYVSARELKVDRTAREKWGNRLYGCQTCQDVCPYNRNVRIKIDKNLPGEIGPSISLKRVLSLEERDVKAMFKGTQMGLSWVSGDAIRRNAILAAGNIGDSFLVSYLKPYRDSRNEMLREAAEWALRKIGAERGKPEG